MNEEDAEFIIHHSSLIIRMEQPMRSSRLTVGISLGLAVLTMAAFGDLLWSRQYDFVNFDDYEYVLKNEYVRVGWTADSLWWGLTSLEAFNWHPLTWFSLQLDAHLFGTNPRAFHATNVMLHAANVVLLFLVLRRLTGAVWRSAAVAAFFALHPLHVESVAWVSERKDVLSTFFWMLTMLAYTRYAERPGTVRYMLVVLYLTLGLMSKPMLVTLPCVLLLLDYWPLCRCPFSPPAPTGSADETGEPHHASLTRLILEKIPLFLLAAVCCWLTIRAQNYLIDRSQTAYPFGARLLNALVSYVGYLGQMFWPSDLAILYLHPGTTISTAQGLAAGLLLAGITLVAVLWRQRRPYVLVGWLWYLGTLVPVIGLLQVGQQARADRYTYVPLIGIFIVLSWGAAEWLGRRCLGRVALSAATAALLLGCALVSWSQVQHWRNSTTLWDRAVQVSGDAPAMCTIAAKVFDQNKEPEGIRYAEKLCQVTPHDWRAYQILALLLRVDNRYDDAVEKMREAVKLEPNNVEVRKQMARFYWEQKNIPAAYRELAEVARLDPECADAQHYLGTVLQQKGKLVEAVRCFQRAVNLAPDSPLYHCDLAFALEEVGNSYGARLQYKEAFAKLPDWPARHDQLARILATHSDALRRDGPEAVRRAREACFVTGYKYPLYLETLAAAYAESGLFKEAIQTAQSAKELAVEKGDGDLAKRLDRALHEYKKGRPSREVTEAVRAAGSPDTPR
jgi:tetratricopeptide (TPR) repeat protein